MSRPTDIVPLPSDPSILVTIQKLSWTQIKAAKRAAQIASARDVIEYGGAQFLQAFEAIQKATPQSAVAADPKHSHDPLTVLVSGAIAWSKPEPLTSEALADLDEQDADVLIDAILALSYPKAPTEDEEKNDLSAFSASSTGKVTH